MVSVYPVPPRFSRWAAQLAATLQSSCELCNGLAPPGQLCVGCTNDIRHSMRHHPWRCSRCALALPAPIACPDCAEQTPVLEKVIAAFDYVAPANSLILRYKNARQFRLASVFASLMLDALDVTRQANGALPWPAHTPLVPIPGSRRSLRRRGFNPAAECAIRLGRELNMPVVHSLLYRESDHLKQSTLNRRQRQANTAHLYYCARNSDWPCAVLVDDVLTTGSTLNTAARALRAAGTQHVFAIVIARTPNLTRNHAHHAIDHNINHPTDLAGFPDWLGQ